MQEKELGACKQKIAGLEKALADRDILIEGLNRAVAERDEKIRNTEAKTLSLESSETKMQELTNKYEKEKERLEKLYSLSKELDTELANMKKEVKARDRWFLGIETSIRKIANSLAERSRMVKMIPEPATVKPGVSKKRRSRRKK
jgi:uncharacterized coiled-coil protein SlyX